jgi:uncharacterized phosphosugar-binding protein
MSDVATIARRYRDAINMLLDDLERAETDHVNAAAERIAAHIAEDRLVYVYGPGGHSNLAAQEVFFRAGGLMHVSAILDDGTLLSNGALRSMAMERTPGYGVVVIDDWGLGSNDLLILVNAYGINAALIDAALEAKRRGTTTIGISSVQHASSTAPEHPARHPTKQNLHDLVDYVIDSHVPVGDAVLDIAGVSERVGAISTFANAYLLNWLMATATERLAKRGVSVPVWRSGNAPGGDEANATALGRFRGRVRRL